MHSQPTNNSEQRIADWRRELEASGYLRDWQVEELEDHLLTTLDLAREEFCSEDLAWHAAIERMGPAPQLTLEYSKEHTMNPISKLAGIGITLGLIWLVVFTGPNPVHFIHIPSLIFVLFFITGGLIASFGPGRVKRALSASMRGMSRLDVDEVASLGKVFQRGYRLAWMSGALGSLLSVMQMLQQLSDPSQIGRGLAAAMLCICYGALFAEVFFANAQQWITGRARVAS
ncbi:MAG: hypothetical protein ACI841_004670 [Planctomycetota bacterium]|jgi:hypothetical protein